MYRCGYENVSCMFTISLLIFCLKLVPLMTLLIPEIDNHRRRWKLFRLSNEFSVITVLFPIAAVHPS